MALLSIDDLFTPQTAEEIRADMVTKLVALDIPADKWHAGGVASTMLTVISIVFEAFSQLIVDIIHGFFLPTATGLGLKLLATHMYGVTVPDATFASGDLTFTNSGGGIYSFGIGEYTALNPTTKITYTNTAAFTVPALGTTTATVQATTIGAAGSSTPNTITENVTSMLGVTVTNPLSLIGVDAPTDAAIRQLCLNKLGASSVRGVRTAYAYAIQVATNSVTGDPVNVNRWAISESSHVGLVTLLVASPSGSVDPNDITGIETSVEENARPAGVGVVVTGATAVAYAPTITIWVTPGSGNTQAQIKTAADTAIADYISVFPIGGVTAGDDTYSSFTGLFGEGIIGAIAEGVSSVGAKLLSVRGASDLALTSGQIASDGVTTTITLVPSTSGVL